MPYWRLHYHLVWATRDREPLLGPEEEALVRRSIHLTAADLDLVPHAVGVMPDHVHVALSIPPKVAVAEAVKRLKGASAHGVNQSPSRADPSTFGWQGEYGALTFGDAALPSVVAYIQNQANHHAENRLWPKLERAQET
ncbi:MAG: IS200/IS605 family transposase [Thermomicrobiales bacterium]